MTILRTAIGTVVLILLLASAGGPLGAETGTPAGADAPEPRHSIHEKSLEDHYLSWRKFVNSPDVRVFSDPDRYTDHPDFLAIVEAGRKAMPFVMEKIANGDFLMNQAAKRITGVNIWKAVEHEYVAGQLYGARHTSQLWLRWWAENKDK